MTNPINCIIVDDEPTAQEVLKLLLGKINMIKIVAVCSTAIEALDVLRSKTVDLVFLDINMPEISGLAFAKMLTAATKVIFTTAYREYALDGFELKAVDYLLKPIAFERLLQAVNRYFETTALLPVQTNVNHNLAPKTSMFVRSERKMVKVSFEKVRYIESLSDYLRIHLENKQIVTRQTISNIAIQLPQQQFMRIHRSFIVGIQHIHAFTHEFIEVEGKMLPISRHYKQAVLHRLGQLG